MNCTPRTASPWDALLLSTPPRRAPSDSAPGGAKPDTKLAGLLALLNDKDSATTLTLAVCADLTPRQVWGLLKQPRAIGQVQFVDGRWALCEHFPGRDVQRAIELLRAKGYRIQEPLL
jgi:hypothetical protein